MFENLVQMNREGEINWWTDVEKLVAKYVRLGFEEIKNMTKGQFKTLVNSSVQKTALEELVSDCKSKKKTSSLNYEVFKMQEYLKTFYPTQAKTIFKCRSETLDLKCHSTYKYSDLVCRKCNIADETVEHAMNCDGTENLVFLYKTEKGYMEDPANTKRCVRKLEAFIDEVT